VHSYFGVSQLYAVLIRAIGTWGWDVGCGSGASPSAIDVGLSISAMPRDRGRVAVQYVAKGQRRALDWAIILPLSQLGCAPGTEWSQLPDLKTDHRRSGYRGRIRQAAL